jgi:quercetin dioxygenase-like cupin family protein
VKAAAELHRALGVVCFALFATSVHAEGDSLTPLRVLPDEVVWTASPFGYHTANIAGHPAKPGMYVNRVRFPAGLRVQPHFHPDERVVIVVSGTVYFGYGEQFDEAAMKAMPAGSVWTEPARQAHFAWAKDGEAVVQVVGNGPSGVVPIAPKQ